MNFRERRHQLYHATKQINPLYVLCVALNLETCGYTILDKQKEACVEEAKILKNGQLVIPNRMRRKLGLKPGDSVKLFDYDGAIHIIPSAKNPVKEGIGILPRRPSLSKKLLNDRARE